jgi:hypothetical protein
MNRKFHLRVLSILLLMTFLVQPLARALVPSVEAHQIGMLNELASTFQGTSDTFLPLILQPPGPPAFEISNPGNGWTISGSLWFAIQVTKADTVNSVTFHAGATVLGTDNTPGDGFKIFLDASALPAGNQSLTATATGPSGILSQSISVNVVPTPPSSGILGTSGGVLASEIGSVITIPPGALPDGTSVSVTEKSQEDITTETGIDWDAMGVTFLGAQDIQTDAAFSLPLGVSSAGFGNRVQPGQTVVNYQLIPDVDGDGVDELVVVNTASVMPNNDVVSDPVPQVVMDGSVQVTSNMGTTTFLALEGGISGPPGTWLQFDVSGFNPLSMDGNVAVWTSLADGTVYEIAGNVNVHSLVPEAQIFETAIPLLPTGGFSLVLRNESTGYMTAPMNVTIHDPVLPTRPAVEVIDDFFAQSIGFVNSQIGLFPEDLADQLTSSVVNLQALQADLDELAVDPSPEEEKVLNHVAVILENSGVLVNGNFQAKTWDESGDCVPKEVLDTLKELGQAMSAAGWALWPYSFLLPPPLSIFVAEVGLSYRLIGGFLNYIVPAVANAFDLVCSPNDPPPPCIPTQNGPGSLTGMGSAPPPGGNGCGNVLGNGNSSLFNNLNLPDQAPGDMVIKIFSNSLPGPFSGLADPGGYFFIPLIPEDEPYVALAIDTATGETRSFEGIGPATGDSTYMFFDFYTNITTTVPVQIGEIVSGTISTPGELDFYTFTANAGQLVYFDIQAGFNAEWDWKLLDSQGNVVFNRDFQDDPGAYTLTAGGTYTMMIGNQISTFTGSYLFQLLGFMNGPQGQEPD